MNKEIINILNELLEIPQSTNGTLNFYEIESNKFEAIIMLVKKQLEDLQHQLEEKKKIIDEKNKCLLEIAKEEINFIKYLKSKGMNFDNESWIKELEEILERGKNEKEN